MTPFVIPNQIFGPGPIAPPNGNWDEFNPINKPAATTSNSSQIKPTNTTVINTNSTNANVAMTNSTSSTNSSFILGPPISNTTQTVIPKNNSSSLIFPNPLDPNKIN